MPNSFTAPHITAAILPDPSGTAAGLGVQAETLTRIGNLTNYLIADAGTESPLVAQNWEDDICAWNGALTQVCKWRVPTISDLHLDLDIQIRAKASAGLGKVYINSSIGGVSVAIAVPNLASTWYEASLTTGAVGVSFNELTMSLEVTGGDVVVSSIVIRYRALTSPLPAGKSSLPYQSTELTPMGTTSLAIDRALSAARGHELSDTLQGVARRPRMLKSWSGLDGIQGFKALAGLHWMYDQSVSERFRVASWGNARAEDVYYVVHAYTSETIGQDRVLKFAEGRVVAVANGSSGWISLTWRAVDSDRLSAEWGFPLAFDELTACPMITVEVAGAGTAIIAPVTSFTFWEVINA